jgi:hypothetical protein
LTRVKSANPGYPEKPCVYIYSLVGIEAFQSIMDKLKLLHLVAYWALLPKGRGFQALPVFSYIFLGGFLTKNLEIVFYSSLSDVVLDV